MTGLRHRAVEILRFAQDDTDCMRAPPFPRHCGPATCPQVEFASEASGGAADLNDFTGLDFLEGQSAGRKMWAEVLNTIGRRLEYHYGDSAPRQILLIAEIRIHRDQHIKFSFRYSQELAIFSS